MKIKFLLFLCLPFIGGQAFSQKKVSGYADVFTYDAVGNRIKREYIWTVVSSKNSFHEEQQVDTLKEPSDNNHFANTGIIVKAYPNPVADEMIVENLSWKDGSKATVKITDITGRVLQEKSFNTAKEQFTLASFVTGTYIVSYYLNSHLFTTWKIIKK
jgi:hypothetical protein